MELFFLPFNTVLSDSHDLQGSHYSYGIIKVHGNIREKTEKEIPSCCGYEHMAISRKYAVLDKR